MKKVLCLVLSLVMLLCLVACDNSQGKTDLFDLIDQGRVPVTITTTVSYNYIDEANADNNVSLSGYYKTVNEWDRSIFTFTYERLPTVEEKSDTLVKTISGTIYKDGDKVSTDGDTFEDASALPGFGITVDLKEENFPSYTVSEDGKSFSATLTGDNIEKALGVKLSCNDEGVKVTVTSNGTVLSGITVAYKTASGADLFIATSYTYTPTDFAWPQ